jgi:predicted transposase YdaD
MGTIKKPADVQWAQRMLDLIETIMVYKLPRLDREAIQKMLNINEVELKQARFHQDVFAEGERRGELKGEARLIVRLLTRRVWMLSSTSGN